MFSLIRAYQFALCVLVISALCVFGHRNSVVLPARYNQTWTGAGNATPGRYNQTWARPQPAGTYQHASKPYWYPRANTSVYPVGNNSNIGWGLGGWNQIQQLPGGARG